MSRQGLMDDAGYDFFDVSDCANYESCREDAFNDGYEKGRADAIEWLKSKKDEIIRWLIKRDKEGYGTTKGELLDHVFELAEQMKEQK